MFYLLFQNRLLLQGEATLQPLLPDGALVQIVTEGEEKGAEKGCENSVPAGDEKSGVNRINEKSGDRAINQKNGIDMINENGIDMMNEKNTTHTINEENDVHTINEKNLTPTINENATPTISDKNLTPEEVLPTPLLNTQAEAARESQTPLANPLVPRLTNPQLALTPSLAALRAMTEEQLRRVEHASIACPGIGRVEWEEPVDLRRLDLDALVSFAVEDGYPTVAVGLRRGGEW